MQFEEILAYVGSYMTYDEFVKNCPEVELSKHDWYKLNQDKTYQQTKSELKRLTWVNFRMIGKARGNRF